MTLRPHLQRQSLRPRYSDLVALAKVLQHRAQTALGYYGFSVQHGLKCGHIASNSDLAGAAERSQTLCRCKPVANSEPGTTATNIAAKTNLVRKTPPQKHPFQ